MKTLIVYYSRTGHTARLAQRLADALKATLMPLTEPGSRLGFIGYQRCLFEAVLKLDGRIQPSPRDPADYDLVLIGTPIWGWNLSSPVRAYVRRHADRIGHCAFFCTMGGSGADAAFAELHQLLGHAPLATLALTEAELDSAAAAAKVGQLVATLGGHAPKHAQPRSEIPLKER